MKTVGLAEQDVVEAGVTVCEMQIEIVSFVLAPESGTPAERTDGENEAFRRAAVLGRIETSSPRDSRASALGFVYHRPTVSV